MKKFCSLLVAVVIAINVFAASEDKKIDTTLPEINTLKINGEVSVHIVYGKENRIEGTIPSNQQDNFSWKIINGTNLTIELKKPLNLDGREVVTPMSLTIYVSNLTHIECKNRATVMADKPLKSETLNIETSNNTVVSLPVECKDLRVKASMGAIVNIKGETESLYLNSSYAALFNAKELEAEVVTVNALTDSECFVKGSKVLTLKAKMKGHIFYFKNDAIVNKKVSTLGEISEYK